MLDLDISAQAGRKSEVDIHASKRFLEEAAMFQTATVVIVQGPRLGKKSSSAIENRLEVEDRREKVLPFRCLPPMVFPKEPSILGLRWRKSIELNGDGEASV